MAPGLYDVILGSDFLEAKKSDINFQTKTITFLKGNIVTPLGQETLPPLSETIIPVNIRGSSDGQPRVLEPATTAPVIAERCTF